MFKKRESRRNVNVEFQLLESENIETNESVEQKGIPCLMVCRDLSMFWL